MFRAAHRIDLLMMSGMPLETCWAFNERWINKFYYKAASCWLFLLSHVELCVNAAHRDSTDTYGLTQSVRYCWSIWTTISNVQQFLKSPVPKFILWVFSAMIHTNKWTDETGTLQNFEYMYEQGTNNVKMDLEETGYEYWTDREEMSVMMCAVI